MKAGHPAITTIDSMVLSIDDPKVFEEMTDNVKSALQATIKTDVGEYFVYLTYERRADNSKGFKILDMTKLS